MGDIIKYKRNDSYFSKNLKQNYLEDIQLKNSNLTVFLEYPYF